MHQFSTTFFQPIIFKYEEAINLAIVHCCCPQTRLSWCSCCSYDMKAVISNRFGIIVATFSWVAWTYEHFQPSCYHFWISLQAFYRHQNKMIGTLTLTKEIVVEYRYQELLGLAIGEQCISQQFFKFSSKSTCSWGYWLSLEHRLLIDGFTYFMS